MDVCPKRLFIRTNTSEKRPKNGSDGTPTTGQSRKGNSERDTQNTNLQNEEKNSYNYVPVPYLRWSSSVLTGTFSDEDLRLRRPAPISAAVSATSGRSLPPNTLAGLLPTPPPLAPPPAPLFQLGIKVSSSRAWRAGGTMVSVVPLQSNGFVRMNRGRVLLCHGLCLGVL